jgi:ribosomal protein S3
MLKYSKLSKALLEPKQRKIKPLKGFKLTVQGRLNGVRRARKMTMTHKGVSPNTISSAIKQYQLPLNTK